MTKYIFETRELVPYRKDWGKAGLAGALWYVQEKDGIFLLDTVLTRPFTENAPKLDTEIPIAKGLPAALLAQGDTLMQRDFNFVECYQAYFQMGKELYPDRLRYHMPTVMKDWDFTLAQMVLMDDEPRGLFSKLVQMRVAVFLRDLSNPYLQKDLLEQLNRNYYYTCLFPFNAEPQLLFSVMPNVAERREAPIIMANDLSKEMETAKLQADGFTAAIINLAIFHDWKKRWSNYDFTNSEVIERIIKAYNNQSPIINLVDLDSLSFDLPIEVEEICNAYMAAFEPIMRKVWKMKPDVQLECIEGDNIYTYIYAHEISSIDKLLNSELYANLNDHQKRNIYSYSKRFTEWLVKTYPITTASQHRIMQAIGRDMPPIELTLHTNVQVTRTGNQGWQSEAKFKYIISDDAEVIQNIHKRIELYLSSPAGLRDELAKLHDEKLISLPMDKPTDIIREIRNIWQNAPKERSFVTTWGRRF